ncbi:MAG: alpha-galactosidase [Acutalibacteraceae bacterium]
MIQYLEASQMFKLDTPNASYIFEIFKEGYLVHLYYGAKLPDANVSHLRYRSPFASFCPENEHLQNIRFSIDVAPMEYSFANTGDYRPSAFNTKDAKGIYAADLRYKAHRIYSGAPVLPDLPCLNAVSDTDADTLEVDLFDAATGAVVTLLYTVFQNYDVIARSVRVQNTGSEAFHIEAVHSLCVDLPDMDYDMVHLHGRWGKERTAERRPIGHGLQGIASKRGSSGHSNNPFVALAKHTATEESGEVYGFNLVYSGNFSAEIAADTYDCTRVILGINPEMFSWKLEPGEVFHAPQAVMVYSNNGLGGMSRTFHKLYRRHLIRGRYKTEKRPLLLNSWEGCGFNFDTEKLLSIAQTAKELGIEMLVMDDGWFGVRNDDTTSLGDWFVNEDKLKGGLSALVERIHAMGLQFGIWYEPEMISPDSELYRAHPDWCLHIDNRPKSIGRQQYVIDMTREEVRNAIFEQMYAVLSKTPIDYLKWDFNRNLTEVACAAYPADRQGEIFHRFVLGTYALMDRLCKAFPDMLIENCSGGGGRFDPGMLYYSPQIWCSDNTDPIERLTIQFGTSLCYPACTMGAHVSANPRAGYETKADVALWGSFGYELDPNKLDDATKDLIRSQIAEYHKYYDLTHNGELYRLITPTENFFRCAWQLVSEDKSEALVTVVNIRRNPCQFFLLRLAGLDENAYYRIEETGEVYSGALLMHAGLNCTDTSNKDNTTFKIYLQKV